MGNIATNKNQVTLIYNSNNSLGKQALGYVNASEKEVRSIDTAKTNIPSSQWVDISKKLNIEINALIEKEHPDFLKLYKEEVALEKEGWLKVIDKNPQVVAFPILIVGEDYFQINTPSEITNHIEDDMAKKPRNPRSKE